MSFNELNLHPAILKAIVAAGYTEATPVQAQAIPQAIAGRDLMVSSQTGSGKTAAFMLPALHLLANCPRAASEFPAAAPARDAARRRGPGGPRGGNDFRRSGPAKPRMLVLTPTRELALQVTTACEKYGSQLRGIQAISILGGMPYPKQLQLLARNPEILVATPGRLIDHMQSGRIDFSDLRMLVLDEADRMLDMGFVEDIEMIVAATPESRQTMLFSATLEGQVARLAEGMMRDPLVIRVDTAATRHENIEQSVLFVDDLAHKNRLLDHLLRDASLGQAVVFTATRRDADLIAVRLGEAGFSAAPLHGDMNQGARNRTLTAMRRGQVRILVATDVAARGIDVPGITHVFNFDLPKMPEDYVHRIGRTGRAGRNGTAISLVHHADGYHVKRIERFTRQDIPVSLIPGHEPQRAAAPRKPRPDARKPGSGRPGRPGGAPARSGQGQAPWGSKPRFEGDRGGRNDRGGDRAAPRTGNRGDRA